MAESIDELKQRLSRLTGEPAPTETADLAETEDETTVEDTIPEMLEEATPPLQAEQQAPPFEMPDWMIQHLRRACGK